jgi:cobaltochelatase CobS
MTNKPDTLRNSSKTFGMRESFDIPSFSIKSEFVPDIDPNYIFDEPTTRAILAGFMNNKRVLIQGFHGTGKSTHIEQVAARLNWPLIRINLDGHISRIDLIGRDAIVLKEGKQVTEFKQGLLPYAMENGIALVFDEYDAGRPDVMFVIQRVLEADGKLTLLDQNKIVAPHTNFRLFATANTVGLGDPSGMYHGTNPINQGQMDRWNIVVRLDYLPQEREENIIAAKVRDVPKSEISAMVSMANLTRESFKQGDITTVMSPRTVISWAENYKIFGNARTAFDLSYLNKCDPSEWVILEELYQRAMG